MARKAQLPNIPLEGADDARWSVISSVHDLPSQPSDDLLELALSAAKIAHTFHLPELEARSSQMDATWIRTWPGEHYRLLAAIVSLLSPSEVIEIGTFKGHGALALSTGHEGAHITTYDIVPWSRIEETAFLTSDFSNNRIEQRIGDLGDPEYRRAQLDVLSASDILFIDGPKDGHWEQDTIPELLSSLTDRRRLVIIDDIRLLPMVQLWRDLPFPKLDITSLGHWSGTGLLFTEM